MSSTQPIRTSSRAETARVGEAIARLLQPGDVVVLTGELGAGKTALTSGLAAGLGSDEPVTSPTFTIMRHHALPAGGQLLHLDAYRLSGPADAEDVGLLELLDGGAIAVIEWGERIADALGPDQLVVIMSHDVPVEAAASDDHDRHAPDDRDDNHRVISVHGRGERWATVDLSAVRP